MVSVQMEQQHQSSEMVTGHNLEKLRKKCSAPRNNPRELLLEHYLFRFKEKGVTHSHAFFNILKSFN